MPVQSRRESASAARNSERVEMVRKPARRSSTRAAAAVARRAEMGMQRAVDEAGDRVSGEADDEGCGDDEERRGEGEGSGAGEGGVVRGVARREGERRGEEDGGGGEIEGALDGVNRDLRGDGCVQAAGDEPWTSEIGEAAEEGDRGKADELRGEQMERGCLAHGREQHGPAHRAQQVAGVDAGHAQRDAEPGDGVELLSEGVRVKAQV
jgi:hypothetical protein